MLYRILLPIIRKPLEKYSRELLAWGGLCGQVGNILVLGLRLTGRVTEVLRPNRPKSRHNVSGGLLPPSFWAFWAVLGSWPKGPGRCFGGILFLNFGGPLS